jgi:malonyl-CoA decarboxylase
MGDVSPKGLRQSHGLMVNYLYDLGHIDENYRAFANQGKIAASSAVLKLAREPSQPPSDTPRLPKSGEAAVMKTA